ncbi:MAG: ribosome silencing factor [Bacteroidales bacterium]|nr:ribosome silencing factor [Bacteroidales bacterium]
MRIRHENDNTEEVLATIVETMLESKASGVTSLDMRELQSAVTDYFVICHAQSKTQVNAIAEKIIDNLRNKLHVHVYHEEGFENSEWILLDYIDVVVHIFLQEKRDFYRLEDLWADAEMKVYED